MQDRYWLYQRENGVFYLQDKITCKQQSLKTRNAVAANRLLAGKNQSVELPMLNRSMAKTYLAAKSPELMERTWADVIAQYVNAGVPESRDRKERAFRSQPFMRLLKVKLLDTEADHLFAVLEHKKAGNAAHHYLRRIHNYALHLGWLLAPVMADAAWPAIRRKHFEAITEEEHLRILECSAKPRCLIQSRRAGAASNQIDSVRPKDEICLGLVFSLKLTILLVSKKGFSSENLHHSHQSGAAPHPP
jgi:hypothetical protein